jgi:hypothetical protein
MVIVANSSIATSGTSTFQYNFTTISSGTMQLGNLTISSLNFAGSGASFVSATGGVVSAFSSNFSSVISSAPGPLIVDHRSGSVNISISQCSFQNLTVCRLFFQKKYLFSCDV